MRKPICIDEEPVDLDRSLKIYSGVIGTEYDVFLNEIREPDYYSDLFYTLKIAREPDIINLILNSEGGDAYTTIQLMTRIKECHGTVIGCAEGYVASAGAMIFLACDAWKVGPNISFMAHNYSGGLSGKGNEMVSRAEFEEKWSRELMYNCYKGFLTDKEIDELLAGKDYWMDNKEVMERLGKLITYREKEYKKAKK